MIIEANYLGGSQDDKSSNRVFANFKELSAFLSLKAHIFSKKKGILQDPYHQEVLRKHSSLFVEYLKELPFSQVADEVATWITEKGGYTKEAMTVTLETNRKKIILTKNINPNGMKI
jgi:hypothetical protein